MSRHPPGPDTRIVVFEITLEDEPEIVGMLADRVHTVSDIALSTMEEAPKVGMRWRPEFVRGIAKHDGKFIIVPEMGNIFKNDAAAFASLEAEERT
jgi:purine-binding chemotaxis protein CheW